VLTTTTLSQGRVRDDGMCIETKTENLTIFLSNTFQISEKSIPLPPKKDVSKLLKREPKLCSTWRKHYTVTRDYFRKQ
jgi:hypothetical protein